MRAAELLVNQFEVKSSKFKVGWGGTPTATGRVEDMMSVGRELRGARERKGLSLEDLSKLTKLRAGVLRALEDGNPDALPPLVFVRGYIAAYAREVDLDAPDVAERGTAELLTEAMHRKVQRAYREAERAKHPVILEPITKQDAAQSAAPIAALMQRRSVTIAGSVLLALFSYVAFAPGGATSSAPVAAASLVAASTPAASSAAPVFRVELTPTQPVFVSASADGQSLFARQLNPGERHVLESTDRLVLRVSDPRAVTWTIDGKPAKPLGLTHDAVTVHVSRENLRQFLN